VRQVIAPRLGGEGGEIGDLLGHAGRRIEPAQPLADRVHGVGGRLGQERRRLARPDPGRAAIVDKSGQQRVGRHLALAIGIPGTVASAGKDFYNKDMINVTEMAAEKITELLAEENKIGAGLRVFVQGGGCSGFQYGLMIDEGEGDAQADQVFEVNGVRLFVDPISMRYLKGAEVDFVDNNMGGGFTIKNPNAKSTCGCGSSFSA